ncbi:BTAD domain-containing putative transcriptional regulator [Rhodococcus sp. NPDC003348]
MPDGLEETDGPEPPGSLDLRVLGPVTALRGGAPVDLGGGRQRALLAALVLAHPHTVSADRLLAQVWHGVDQPKLSSLHVAISKLRDALSPDRARRADGVLVRDGTRYALAVDRTCIDVARFEDLVRGADQASATPEIAAERYREALSLWRGSAYADIGGAEFAAPEVTRLAALHLDAVKSLLGVDLTQGRYQDVATRAQVLVADHPLDERAWEILVLAQYRAARQSDALASLRRIRGILDDELGIDPGIGLRDLERAVLAQDDSLTPATVPVPVAPAPARASNLPTPRTRLVGRDLDVESVTALLSAHQLVTLVGPGGVGKTRLAVEVCGRRPDEDGPWLVDLGAVTGGLVAAATSSALGLPGVGTAEHLAGVLAGRKTALILDNCEHVVAEAADLAAALIGQCPQVQVLATSREPLDVDGEVLFDVAPLDTDSAVELFATRAGGVVEGWILDESNATAVHTICRELDGIPLGIELAAAQLRVLSEQQIADGLGDRFTLLRNGSRSAPPRQRRLVDTIDWSYRLLDDEQARVLRQVAVFADSFDLAGAAAVTGAASEFSAVEPLTALVRRSLLKVLPGTSPRRYRMMQTIKQFALDQAEPEEHAAAALAHREHVRARVAAAGDGLYGTHSVAIMNEIAADDSEHRSAMASALAAGDPHYALEISGGLYWFWYRRGRIGEGLGFLNAAVDGVAASAAPVDRENLAHALTGIASLTYLTGDAAGAAQAARRASELWEAVGVEAHAARMQAWEGYFHSMQGDHDAAVVLCRRGVERTIAAESTFGEADARMVLGMVLRNLGRSQEAWSELVSAIACGERVGNRWVATSSTWALMKAAMDLDRLDDALAAAVHMQEMLEIDGDVTSWLVLVHTSAAALARRGSTVEAVTLAGAVHSHGSRIGFLPEWMDPVDGPREAATIRGAVSAEDYRRHAASGADLSRDQVNELLAGALARWVPSGE